MERNLMEFIRDVIQDSRCDSVINNRYDTIIDYLLNSAELTYDKNELRQDAYDVMKVVKILEPRRYFDKLEQLQKKEEKRKQDVE